MQINIYPVAAERKGCSSAALTFLLRRETSGGENNL